METEQALGALGALAHPTRLDAFRLLVRREPEGCTTGELVAASGLSQSTFSTHLAVLVRTGLVRSERRGRTFVQRAQIARLGDLVDFLARDCCGGHPELCGALEARSIVCGAKA